MGLPSVSTVAHAALSPHPSSRATPHLGALPPQLPATDAATCPRQPSTYSLLLGCAAVRSPATADPSAGPDAPLPQQPATDTAAEILPTSSWGMLRNSPAEHGSKRLSCPACAASHRALSIGDHLASLRGILRNSSLLCERLSSPALLRLAAHLRAELLAQPWTAPRPGASLPASAACRSPTPPRVRALSCAPAPAEHIVHPGCAVARPLPGGSRSGCFIPLVLPLHSKS